MLQAMAVLFSRRPRIPKLESHTAVIRLKILFALEAESWTLYLCL